MIRMPIPFPFAVTCSKCFAVVNSPSLFCWSLVNLSDSHHLDMLTGHACDWPLAMGIHHRIMNNQNITEGTISVPPFLWSEGCAHALSITIRNRWLKKQNTNCCWEEKRSCAMCGRGACCVLYSPPLSHYLNDSKHFCLLPISVLLQHTDEALSAFWKHCVIFQEFNNTTQQS